MTLTLEEQHEINDLDHDTLTHRHVTFTCGHERDYNDMSACQKQWLENNMVCPVCEYRKYAHAWATVADHYGNPKILAVALAHKGDYVEEDMRIHPELWSDINEATA